MMHQCQFCPESFFSWYSLASHIRSHDNGNLEYNKLHQERSRITQPTSSSETRNHNPDLGPASTIVPGQVGIMEYTWKNHHVWNVNEVSRRDYVPKAAPPAPSQNVNNEYGRVSEDDSDDDGEETESSSNNYVELTRKPKKTFECPICQKVFRSYPGLRYHRNSKHDQNGPYKCKFCDKRFCQMSHLTRHETLHTGEKNYACTYCDKTFRIKGNLQIHIRIHTGEKPYSCSKCGKKFTQQQSAKSHEKLHLKCK